MAAAWTGGAVALRLYCGLAECVSVSVCVSVCVSVRVMVVS
jgi:hypothetical protein